MEYTIKYTQAGSFDRAQRIYRAWKKSTPLLSESAYEAILNSWINEDLSLIVDSNNLEEAINANPQS